MSQPTSISSTPFPRARLVSVRFSGIPSTISMVVTVEVGAMVEPLAVAWRVVKRSNVKSGDSVLILGAGPVSVFDSPILRKLRFNADSTFDPRGSEVSLINTLGDTSSHQIQIPEPRESKPVGLA